jgi:hypothetical protein
MTKKQPLPHSRGVSTEGRWYRETRGARTIMVDLERDSPPRWAETWDALQRAARGTLAQAELEIDIERGLASAFLHPDEPIRWATKIADRHGLLSREYLAARFIAISHAFQLRLSRAGLNAAAISELSDEAIRLADAHSLWMSEVRDHELVYSAVVADSNLAMGRSAPKDKRLREIKKVIGDADLNSGRSSNQLAKKHFNNVCVSLKIHRMRLPKNPAALAKSIVRIRSRRTSTGETVSK